MKNPSRFWITTLLLLMTAMVLAGCPSSNKQTRTLDLTLQQYEKAVRWSQWDVAANHIDPQYLADNPISRLDMDRLRLFRVTQYNVRSSVSFDAGLGFQQVVEIRLFNRNRAVERTFIDQQEWRYNADSERWFLHTGLPDVTQAR